MVVNLPDECVRVVAKRLVVLAPAQRPASLATLSAFCRKHGKVNRPLCWDTLARAMLPLLREDDPHIETLKATLAMVSGAGEELEKEKTLPEETLQRATLRLRQMNASAFQAIGFKGRVRWLSAAAFERLAPAAEHFTAELQSRGLVAIDTAGRITYCEDRVSKHADAAPPPSNIEITTRLLPLNLGRGAIAEARRLHLTTDGIAQLHRLCRAALNTVVSTVVCGGADAFCAKQSSRAPGKGKGKDKGTSTGKGMGICDSMAKGKGKATGKSGGTEQDFSDEDSRDSRNDAFETVVHDSCMEEAGSRFLHLELQVIGDQVAMSAFEKELLTEIRSDWQKLHQSFQVSGCMFPSLQKRSVWRGALEMRLHCMIEFCPPDELQVLPDGTDFITPAETASVIKMVAGCEPAFKVLDYSTRASDDKGADQHGELAPSLKKVQFAHQVEIMVAVNHATQFSADSAEAELWVWPTAWAVPDTGAGAVAKLEEQMKRARQAVIQAIAVVQKSSCTVGSGRRNFAPVLQRTLSLEMSMGAQHRARGVARNTERNMGGGRSTTAEEEERREAQHTRQKQKRQQQVLAIHVRKQRDQAHRQQRDAKLNQAQVLQ